MFPDASLSARIDRAEGRLVSDIASGIAATGATVLDEPLGGGRAVMARPGSPVNKIVGVGFEGPIDEEALARVEEGWRARGEPARVELSTLADPEVGSQLTRRGYRLRGFEYVLGRSVEAAAAPSGVPVELATDDRAWLGVVVDGFASPDGTAVTADEIPREAVEAVLGDLTGGTGFRRYVARLDGEVAGGATLRLDEDLAFFCGAATAPRFRRRGVQAALLAARMSDAHAAGASLAIVTTAPGSQSQRNVMRRGFALLYARAVLIREWS